MSFDKRLALFLLDETAKTNSTDLHVTQKEIAKYIGSGSAREMVSRMLNVFLTNGILTQSRGVIHIIDKDKLEI